MDRHPSNHYPTAHDAHSPEEIVARTAERFKCAHPDSVLYMWATIPHLFIALQVMALRGYAYKTSRSWNKLRSGNLHRQDPAQGQMFRDADDDRTAGRA